MTEERLKEIKDSIDFQIEIATVLRVKDETLIEEQELYDEVIRLKKYQESYRKELDYWKIQYSGLMERNFKAVEHIEKVMQDEEEYEDDYIYNKYLLDILQGVEKK